jgi:hypothetical protein
LEDFDAEVDDNNSAWGTKSIRENTKITATSIIAYNEMKRHAQNY